VRGEREGEEEGEGGGGEGRGEGGGRGGGGGGGFIPINPKFTIIARELKLSMTNVLHFLCVYENERKKVIDESYGKPKCGEKKSSPCVPESWNVLCWNVLYWNVLCSNVLCSNVLCSNVLWPTH